MNESEFTHIVDDTLEKIETAIERTNADFDYEIAAGMFVFEFENGVKLILSRQTPVFQLWLATPGGAYHFEYHPEKKQWCDTKTNAELFSVLSTHASTHCGEKITLTPC